jgi:Uma2 family endonuclease
MTLPRPHFTYAEYQKLPDDQRYEVLEGELVMTPAPGKDHQLILLNLGSLLLSFTRKASLGMVFVAPFDVILSEQNVVQPDLLFVSRDRLEIVQERGVFGAPDLVVEILSPSSAGRDLDTKRRLYSKYGVREYWLVDPRSRSVDVLTQQGTGLELWQRYQGTEPLHSPLLPSLSLDLAEIFSVS